MTIPELQAAASLYSVSHATVDVRKYMVYSSPLQCSLDLTLPFLTFSFLKEDQYFLQHSSHRRQQHLHCQQGTFTHTRSMVHVGKGTDASGGVSRGGHGSAGYAAEANAMGARAQVSDASGLALCISLPQPHMLVPVSKQQSQAASGHRACDVHCSQHNYSSASF